MPAETSVADVLVHDPDAVAMKAFRTADLQAGGGHLYASVVRYLQADMAPRLFGTDDGASNPALFTTAAALTDMAGFCLQTPCELAPVRLTPHPTCPANGGKLNAHLLPDRPCPRPHRSCRG